jgi:hypothetical protein
MPVKRKTQHRRRKSKRASGSRRKAFRRRMVAYESANVMSKSIRSVKTAIQFLELSYTEVGIEVARLAKRSYPYSKQRVYDWVCGDAITKQVVKAFGTLLATAMTSRAGRKIGVTIKTNSPWRVTAYGQCECGEYFQLRHARHRRCNRH